MAFSADWLRLREPADRAARSAALAAWTASRLAMHRAPTVLDLATGTGANIRALAPALPGVAAWRAVDHDVALLEALPSEMRRWAVGGRADRDGSGRPRRGDLDAARIACHAADLAALDPALLAGVDLVTTSALLDLVSERWIQDLAAACRDVSAGLLATLTYDGRMELEPGDPTDDLVRRLVNAHQRRDKGFGPALGPDATAAAERAFAAAGYETRRAPSDWVLDTTETRLQRALADGWAAAAAEQDPDARRAIDEWRARRLAHVDAGRSRIRVGHEDLAAWPAATRARLV